VKILSTNLNQSDKVNVIVDLEHAINESPGQVAIYLESIRKQLEMTQTMDQNGITSLTNVVRKYPSLKFIMVAEYENKAIGEVPIVVIDLESAVPDFRDRDESSIKHALHLSSGDLTTMEVAALLDVSPQMVRKYCQENEIEASRTMGNRGEWRIHAQPFFYNRKYLAGKYIEMIHERKNKNEELVRGIEGISKHSEYLKALDEIIENRSPSKEPSDD
jgi:hypothetical protein